MSSSPKKIVFIDDAHTFGGAQIALANAVCALSAESNYEIQIFTPHKCLELRKRLSHLKNITLVDCPSTSTANIFFFWKTLFKWSRIFKYSKLDKATIYIINGGGIEFGLTPALFLKLQKKNVFLWLHLASPLEGLLNPISTHQSYFYKARDLVADFFAFQLYSCIFLPTTAELIKLQSRLKKIKKKPMLSVLYNVSPSQHIQNTAPTILADKTINIAIVGRVQFCHKGQDRTPHIAQALIQAGWNPKFIFIGDGKDRKILEGLFEQKKLREHIKITGWVTDVAKETATVDIILIPSRFESFSLVALESMLQNKRIVASNIDALREVVPKNCTVNENITAEYVKKIELMMNTSEEKLKEIYKPFLEKFSPKSFEKRFSNYLQSYLHIDNA